jgi:hypothetical protein
VSYELPSGLGVEVDALLREAMLLARLVGPAADDRRPAPVIAAIAGAGDGLRSTLLDLAATISVRTRE